jgi:hypothetical protein
VPTLPWIHKVGIRVSRNIVSLRAPGFALGDSLKYYLEKIFFELNVPAILGQLSKDDQRGN